jgi:alkylation response protein AidB-like acyl-CoA dehydrogenase
MDFDLSDEQKMLVDGAARYVREKLGLDARRSAAANADGFSRERWAEFAELGWLSLSVPENFGGLGGSDIDIALLMEELGRGLSPEPYADTAVLGATVICATQNAALRAKLLSQLAAGTCITALAHVEPEGRSEYETPVATSAVRTAQEWQISGIKPRVFHGTAASHWLVSARLGDTPQFGLFLIERGATGTTLTSYELVDGTRSADIRFHETPALALITDTESAAATLELALDRSIVALTAGLVGSMEAVMALTADYLKQRVQYGQSLSKFQALQHRMAEMFVETDQARSMLLQALAALQSGDAVQRRRAASGAKALVTRAAYFVTGQGIQLHGGIGVTEEYAVGHHYKAALSYDKRFGDLDFHLVRSSGLASGPG